jgi:regulatory protein
MKILSKISPQKRRKDRFSLYINDSYAFSLSYDVKEMFKLKEGMKIDDEKIEDILSYEHFGKIYGKIMRFISYKPRSRREVVDRLEKYLIKDVKDKRFHSKLKERIMLKVEDLGFVNDESYAKEYIESVKRSDKSVGRRKAETFLYKKGISREIIDKYIENLSWKVEEKKALAAASKKMKLLKGKRSYKNRNKVYKFLYGRGFSADVIKSVVDTLFEVK